MESQNFQENKWSQNAELSKVIQPQKNVYSPPCANPILSRIHVHKKTSAHVYSVTGGRENKKILLGDEERQNKVNGTWVVSKGLQPVVLLVLNLSWIFKLVFVNTCLKCKWKWIYKIRIKDPQLRNGSSNCKGMYCNFRTGIVHVLVVVLI